MNNKTEGTISMLAAMFVLFTTMLDPMVSMTIALIALLGLGIYDFSKK